jgi:hypothetical protein
MVVEDESIAAFTHNNNKNNKNLTTNTINHDCVGIRGNNKKIIGRWETHLSRIRKVLG